VRLFEYPPGLERVSRPRRCRVGFFGVSVVVISFNALYGCLGWSTARRFFFFLYFMTTISADWLFDSTFCTDKRRESHGLSVSYQILHSLLLRFVLVVAFPIWIIISAFLSSVQ